MKILFDHQAFTMQTLGGVSRYFSELMRGINSQKTFETCLSLKYSNNIYLQEYGFHSHRPFFKKVSVKGGRRVQRLLNVMHSKSVLKLKDYDLFHPTYYQIYHLPFSLEKPLVLTVHDMTHERLPELFSPFENTSELKRILVKRADKIIAVSESTKLDLIEILNVDPNKIEVVYLGSPLHDGPQRQSKTEVNLPKKYLLFVGRRSKYKNFNLFLNAAVKLMMKDKDLEIVCTSSNKFSRVEKEAFSRLGISGRIHSYYFNDSNLEVAYKNAVVFVFPSLYEGFGLPILEAFSASCPVVCSNTSSLPEVAGEGAVYFDPLSEQEVENAMFEVLYNENRRKQLISAGKERLMMFSWEKTVKKTIEVYNSVLN